MSRPHSLCMRHFKWIKKARLCVYPDIKHPTATMDFSWHANCFATFHGFSPLKLSNNPSRLLVSAYPTHRRHVRNQSCGSSVNSHGEAGAVEGLRQKKALAQAPPVDAHPAGQHGRPSLHVATGGQPNSSSTSSAQASQRREASNTQPRGASAHLDLPDAQRHEGGEPARPRHPRVRCMELPHLFAAQRERARQSLVDSHAGLEVTDANSRAPSSRSTTLDGGRNSGAVAPEGLSTN